MSVVLQPNLLCMSYSWFARARTLIVVVVISLRLVLAACGLLLFALLGAAACAVGYWECLHWPLQRALSHEGAYYRYQSCDLLP